MPRISKAQRLREARWAKLPYGRWVRCTDGAEHLFNRRYECIWERHNGGPAGPVMPVGDGVMRDTTWFYTDANTEPERVAAGLAALRAWGLPIPAEFKR